jgi:hypothetical protein
MNDLCIGGGGIDGLMFIGALEYLHENNLLDLKRFYGCSIGSLIGILYISGILPKKILAIVMEIDKSELIKYDFSNIKTNNSILNNDVLESLISNLENYNEITIGDFVKKYGVDINIYATNLTTLEYTNLNKEDYPEIKLKDALMASMSIPFIFPPVIIKDCQYIDGCITNILGSPPSDIFVKGYSIILKSGAKQYIGKVIEAMVGGEPPNSLYTILCDGNLGGGVDVLNAQNLLTHSNIFEMYKSGINCSRNQLTHNNFTTWE